MPAKLHEGHVRTLARNPQPHGDRGRRIRCTPPQDVDDIIHNIGAAARVALGGLPPSEAEIRNVQPIEVQKFDLKVDA